MNDRKKVVVLTGAGISAESGLRTFRDADGLWEGYRIEEVATPRAWKKDPALVLDFYNYRRKEIRNAQPNAAHLALAALERFHDVFIITQNIDDLHERAGSSRVLHLHGEIFKMRSEKQDHPTYPIEEDITLGHFAPDGGQMRPCIVWFEEPVPLFQEAIALTQQADVFAVIGTSLLVYPAASLVDHTPPYISRYIIDRNIPAMSKERKFIPIEQQATTGVPEFVRAVCDQL